MNHFVSSETRKKMSQRISGSNHPMWGKKHTEQSKRKMSLSRLAYLLKKRKSKSNPNPNRKRSANK